MRVLFAGGGTGGHLFPAIAIAEEIKRLDSGSQIEFIGTEYGIEYRMRDSLGYRLHTIAMRGMPRKLSLGLLMFPFRLMKAVRQCKMIMKVFKPDVVVGTGGYVAGPPIMAASKLSIPCALQEQNSFPGLVTRKLANKTNMIFLAYRKAEEFLPSGVSRKLIGNPVRRTITAGDKAEALATFGLKQDRKTVLILGGSQGAHRVNEAILRGLDRLENTAQLLWQCGKRDYTDVAERLDKKDFAVSLFPFSKDMASVYAAADFAIARAGALTIAELTACGIPAILIPYPHATADHQTSNAREMVAAGAAEMIADKDLEDSEIIGRVLEILNSDRYPEMQQAALEIGQPDAAEKIAQDIISLAKGERIDG